MRAISCGLPETLRVPAINSVIILYPRLPSVFKKKAEKGGRHLPAAPFQLYRSYSVSFLFN